MCAIVGQLLKATKIILLLIKNWHFLLCVTKRKKSKDFPFSHSRKSFCDELASWWALFLSLSPSFSLSLSWNEHKINKFTYLFII